MLHNLGEWILSFFPHKNPEQWPFKVGKSSGEKISDTMSVLAAPGIVGYDAFYLWSVTPLNMRNNSLRSCNFNL